MGAGSREQRAGRREKGAGRSEMRDEKWRQGKVRRGRIKKEGNIGEKNIHIHSL